MAEGYLHQLDASVLAELFTPARTLEERLRKREARAYLFSKVGRSVRGLLSVPALGELALTIRNMPGTREDQLDAFERQYSFLEDAGVEINSPGRKAYETAARILERGSRVERGDALRVAEALEANAVLVTVDEDLLRNRVLREEFGARIIRTAR
jgi:predicted nucleic acid-binding protein